MQPRAGLGGSGLSGATLSGFVARLIRGSELGPQAFHQRREQEAPLAPEHFEPVGGSTAWVKPHEGGLWTSSYDPRYGSGWLQWCLSESFGFLPEERVAPRAKLWVLTPAPDALIYRIHTYRDLEVLVATHGRVDPHYAKHGLDRGFPDWKLLASAGIAGVHLTEEGQWATRLSHPHNLYGWDCESTLWLNWAFAEVRELGVVRFEARDPYWCPWCGRDSWDHEGEDCRPPLWTRHTRGALEAERDRRRQAKRQAKAYRPRPAPDPSYEELPF